MYFCLPDSGTRGKEFLLFLSLLSEGGEGESW